MATQELTLKKALAQARATMICKGNSCALVRFNLETQMSIKVGASVTWRHGKSKAGREGTQAPRVGNCIVIELDAAEEGRARIRLPPIFDNQEVKVLIADLEDAE